MKGKHIKGNVCTATHLHPPFLSSFFEIIHLLLFATERLWKSIPISALYRCIMWWWSCYICINVQFSLNFCPSFSSLSLFSTCTCIINTQILISSCFSWEVDRIHTALSTVTFDHYRYFTLKVCIHPLTLTHSQLVIPLQAHVCGYIWRVSTVVTYFKANLIEHTSGTRWDQAPGTTEPPGWWRVSIETTHLIRLRA